MRFLPFSVKDNHGNSNHNSKCVTMANNERRTSEKNIRASNNRKKYRNNRYILLDLMEKWNVKNKYLCVNDEYHTLMAKVLVVDLCSHDKLKHN